jgi:hypothetical protein
MALRNDSSVFGSELGPASLPTSNHVAIAAGRQVRVGLTADGFVTRHLTGTQYNPPSALSNAIDVAASSRTLFAVTAGGDLFAWGENPNGETNVPPGLMDVVSIAAGYSYAAALSADVPYVINSGSVTGYVNTDLVVPLPGRDPNGDPLTFRIVSLPGVGSLFQYESGGRGAPIQAPDTVVADAEGRVVFAPAANAFGSPYTTFVFLVNDGVADSAPATVAVNVILPAAPKIDPLHSGWSTNGSGAFELSFTGTPGATYSTYGSTNLVDWDWLGFADVLSPGVYRFVDGSGTNQPQRFYRAGAP